jgi:hypothetical protein
MVQGYLENVEQANMLAAQVEIITLTTRQLHARLEEGPAPPAAKLEVLRKAVDEIQAALAVSGQLHCWPPHAACSSRCQLRMLLLLVPAFWAVFQIGHCP